jgi:glyoxylase-like metal-dependent hydrolase (beta-lactamase superfamily II)
MVVHTISSRLANCYLLEGNRSLVLIDAAEPGYSGRILDRIQKLKPKSLNIILVTHAHYDHIGGIARIQKSTGAPVAVHESDMKSLRSGSTYLGTPKAGGRIIKPLVPVLEKLAPVDGVHAENSFADREMLIIDEMRIEVIHTPGHTSGSCCFMVNNEILFTGDLLSSTGGLHRQRLFAVDWNDIDKSIAKIKNFTPKKIYPGHGSAPVSGDLLNEI